MSDAKQSAARGNSSDPALEATAMDPASSNEALGVTVPGDSGLAVTEWSGDGDRAGPSVPVDAQAGQADPLLGRILHHFRVEQRIGAGGMGRVYRAHDLSLDRPVALKVIAEQISADPEQRDRFIREARAQAKLNHPNVVGIYYIGEQDGQLFFAMELVQGEALDAPLGRGERILWPEAVEAALAVAEALRLAHERAIVHRDIKPSNLLRDRSGLVKVADFGLAKAQGVVTGPTAAEAALAVTAADSAPWVPGAQPGHGSGSGSSDAALTRQGAVVGSPLYLSPEQGQGEAVDQRSDIYSLGATLYHLIAGRPVFEAKSAPAVIGMHLGAPVPSLRRVAPEAAVPKRLDRILQRMLAKDPGERFQSWDEVIDALQGARPQAVASAGFVVRGIAGLVDYGLVAAPLALFGVFGVVLAGLYYQLCWWLWRGKSVGKWIFRLRIRTDENDRVGFLRCLLRLVALWWGAIVMSVLGLITWAVFGQTSLDLSDPEVRPKWLAVVLIVLLVLTAVAWVLGFLWALIRRHKRAWHDLWSGTMVVYDLPEARGLVRSRAAASAWSTGAITTVSVASGAGRAAGTSPSSKSPPR